MNIYECQLAQDEGEPWLDDPDSEARVWQGRVGHEFVEIEQHRRANVRRSTFNTGRAWKVAERELVLTLMD
jgi:hypothetical protein